MHCRTWPAITIASVLVFVTLAFSAQSKNLTITAEPIQSFDARDADQTRFGKLEFLGGLVLSSDHEDFGGLSAFRFTGTGGKFLAVTDKARLITGRLVRDGDVPVAVKDAQLTRIKNANGRTITGAEQKDSESLVVLGDKIAVGYERDDRIAFFNLKSNTLIMDRKRKPIDFNRFEFRNNNGLEAMALHPGNGALYAFPEIAANENGNYRGFVLENDRVVREIEFVEPDGYSLTDAEFMANGDLILLQRYYSILLGVYMRLKRVSAEQLTKDAPLTGELLIDTSGKQEIDNMEGLALSTLPDGATRVTLVSDDNFSKSQRTLLLEFRLLD